MEELNEGQLREYAEKVKSVKRIGIPWEAYRIDLANKNTVDKIAANLYVEHFLMAAILEAFVWSEEQDFKALNQTVYNFIPEHFLWEVTADKINLVIMKMIRLGYIENIKNEGLPNFGITTLGVEMLQQQTLQSLSATSFFSYQTHKLNKLSTKMNMITIGVAVLSVIIAIVALIAG